VGGGGKIVKFAGKGNSKHGRGTETTENAGKEKKSEKLERFAPPSHHHHKEFNQRW
jgi:hypothetical protein